MITRSPGYLIAFCLLALLFLAACAGPASPTPFSPTEGPTLTPSPDPLPEDATVGAQIRRKRRLVVGVRYDLPPFGFVTDEGQLDGFSIDLGRELAERWLDNADAIAFKQVRSDTAIGHLEAGDVDLVIAALHHTQEREAGADFTPPYFIDGQALLVRQSSAQSITEPGALPNVPIGVTRWSAASDLLPGVVPFTPTLQTYDRFDEAVGALERGEVGAVADLRRRLCWGMQVAPETAIVAQYTAVPVAIAHPQNDAFLANLVNLTLQEIATDGTLDALYARWLGAETPPQVAHWPGDELPDLEDAPASAEPIDTIGAIRSRGRLAAAIVSDYEPRAYRAPFAYMDAQSTPAGYEVDVVRQMAQRWLGDATAVDFHAVPLATGQAMLRDGQVDLLIGGLTHTRAAEMAIDFSLSTYTGGEGFLIRPGTTVTSMQSLNGQQVAVMEGSASQEVLLAEAQNTGVSLSVIPQPSMEAALGALREGQVIAIGGERADLLGFAHDSADFVVMSARLTETPIALGLPPGDSAFRDLINLTLQTMTSDGQLAGIYGAWFDDGPPKILIWPGAPYRELSLTTP